jgi:hypothetical protein
MGCSFLYTNYEADKKDGYQRQNINSEKESLKQERKKERE